jgi:hypothetical protein
MPTIRIGYSSDFSINSNGVGIGTTFAAANTKLDVVGALKGDFNVTGVTTLAAYGGFVAQQQHVNKSTTIGFATVSLGVGTANQYYETETGFTDLGGVHHGDDQYFNTLSEDLVIDDGQILNITNTDMVGVTTIGEYDPHNHSSYVCAGSLEQVSVTGHFSVPNGGINDRQLTPIEGTVRFNDDLNTLEFFNGVEWRQFTYNQGQSGRAVISSGYDASSVYSQKYDYITITTLGNSAYFGDMQTALREKTGCGSAIRALFGGGASPTPSNEIDYLTIASAGNGVDFGNLTSTNVHNSALSSSTRGIWGGGYSGSPGSFTNVIEYVEINTLGNALDFGDLSGDFDEGSGYLASCASPIRGVFAGGTHPTAPGSCVRSAESITIASKGNSTRFGDLTAKHQRPSAASNGIKGLVFSGRDIPDISEISMTSGGVGIHFGNLSDGDYSGFSACNAIRAVHGGGEPGAGGRTNRIEYVTMTTGGNSQDFGDLSFAESFLTATSDSHGGLGGF